jgi:hypothetical protein
MTVNEAKSLVELFEIIFPYMRHQKRISNFQKVKKNLALRLGNGTIQI